MPCVVPTNIGLSETKLVLSLQYGIPTPKSVPAHNPQEAYEVAKNFGTVSLYLPRAET